MFDADDAEIAIVSRKNEMPDTDTLKEERAALMARLQELDGMIGLEDK